MGAPSTQERRHLALGCKRISVLARHVILELPAKTLRDARARGGDAKGSGPSQSRPQNTDRKIQESRPLTLCFLDATQLRP